MHTYPPSLTHITMLSQLCVENDLHVATFCLLITLRRRRRRGEAAYREAVGVLLTSVVLDLSSHFVTGHDRCVADLVADGGVVDDQEAVLA